jgi:hypothetical protein
LKAKVTHVCLSEFPNQIEARLSPAEIDLATCHPVALFPAERSPAFIESVPAGMEARLRAIVT